MACESLEEEVTNMYTGLDALQEELGNASPPQKAAIIKEIRTLQRKINAKERELDACYIANNINPLAITLTGTATLTIDFAQASGPFINPVSIVFTFGPRRRSFFVQTFPAITTDPFETPLGRNTTAVSKVGGGEGNLDQDTGAMQTVLELFFDHSVDVPFFDEDSKLKLFMGTGSVGGLVGSPVNRTTMNVRLVGSNIFEDGILGGNRGSLVIDGVLSQSPFV